MECSDDCACYGVCFWLRTDSAHTNESKSVNDPRATAQGQAVQDEADALVQETEELEDDDKICFIKNDDNNDTSNDKDVVCTYKRRWLMLGLFAIFSLSNAYMWIHLNIIADIILHFYNESLPTDSLQRETAVDWLSLVYLLSYLMFIPFGMYILDSRGLRVNNVVGTFVNAAGAWIKCFTVTPDRFALLMVAQVVCGAGQVFVVSIPPRLAAVWFGPDQVSTATAIGVFGNQLGVAVGFLVPSHVVPSSGSLDEISKDLSTMFYVGAAICTLLFVLMLLVFQTRPPHPPSRAQLLMMTNRQKENYFSSILRLIKSRNFLLILLAYGINTGSFYAISTLLNSMVLHYFPGEEMDVGNIGLTIVIAGIVGSIVAGLWLDYTKYFKSTSVAIFLMSTLGMLAFTFTLDQGKIWIVYLTAGLLGFFMTGYLPVGYEFAAEITYPEPEGTSSGLLTSSAMIFGITLTLGMRAMMNQVSIMASNIFVSAMLLIGTLSTALIKPQYNRQEAEKKPHNRRTSPHFSRMSSIL